MTAAIDDDLRDGAARELTSRLLTTASRDATLALARSLARDAARGADLAEVRAAIATLEPRLGRALREAVDARRPDDEVGTPEVAAALGLSRRQLEKLVAAGRSPIPFARSGRGRPARFLRRDVDAFVAAGEPDAPADEGHAILVEALRRALADAPPEPPRRWTRLAEVARDLGLTPQGLHYQIEVGACPLKPTRIGRRFVFRSSDVAAYVAARTTNGKET